MLDGKVFYHGIIRSTIVAFGSLFSNIYIDRKKDDSVSGQTIQRLQVPLAYAPKEKWIVRIDSDPNLQNNTYTTLPRLSFEITGYNYDAARKANRMNKVRCVDASQDTMKSLFTPVPYNIDIALYVLTKTQEDGLQIIEQILPTFTPDYTLMINSVPSMNIIQDVPVILNSVAVQDDYDGDFQTRRFVTHTLNFTLKLNLYGGLSNTGVIDTVISNVGEDRQFQQGLRIFTAEGDPGTVTVTSESWINDL